MNSSVRQKLYWLLLLMALAAAAIGLGAAAGAVSAEPECVCAPCAPLAQETAPPVDGGGDLREYAETGTARARPPGVCDPAELAAILREIDELRGAKAIEDGMPLSWPVDIPGQYRAESFQALCAEALDEVEAAADLVGFDCDEPPCIAQLRLEEGRAVNVTRSEVWRRNFGTVTREVSIQVPCGDGRREHVHLVAPLWDWQNDPKEMSPRDYDELARAAGLKLWGEHQSEEEAVRDNRLRLRLESILENWRCRPAP